MLFGFLGFSSIEIVLPFLYDYGWKSESGNIKNIKKVKDKLDPRLYNGAILIGLNSPVVKSHGSTDYIGFSNSLKVCEKIVNGNLIEKIKDNIIN